MVCLAGKEEPLDVHIADVARCASERGRLVAKKLARIFGLSEEEALDLLELVAILHDAGKADEEYEGAEDYFPLHEAKSATLAKAIFSELGELGDVAIAAVALHHYSHKEPRARQQAFSFKPRCKLAAVDSWRPRTKLGAVLAERLRKLWSEAQSKGISNTGYNDAVIKAIKDKYPKRALYAVMAVLGVLNRCDKEIAERNRGGERPSRRDTCR